MEKIMIDLDNVCVHYRRTTRHMTSLKEYAIARVKGQIQYQYIKAVDGVSLQIYKAEIIGFVGLNGAGKSTLLKAIAKILLPTSGNVVVNGRIAPLLELGSGFKHELTGRENVVVNGLLLGYPRAYINENIDRIIEFAELEDFANEPIKNYSSGMLGRLGFAIATHVVPEILIVDEALSVGDGRFRKKSEARMHELIQSGATVLFVSHGIQQVRQLCSRVIWLEHGRVKMDGETKEVCDAYEGNL